MDKKTDNAVTAAEDTTAGMLNIDARNKSAITMSSPALAPAAQGETLRQAFADDFPNTWGSRKAAPAPSAGETVLVPREPTPEMHEAAHAASLGAGEPMGPDFPWINAKIYRAMLAAAPTTGETND